jgi:C-terminal processing protease CtpA/Prc
MERGPIIGEPTGGSTGQPLRLQLPGGLVASICSKSDQFPDGTDLVGVGIQPDLLVSPSVADIRAGRDTVLEAAIAEVSKRIEWR